MFKRLINLIRDHAEPKIYEQRVIDAWLENQTAQVQSIFLQQMQCLRLTQRQSDGAKLCFYYDENKKIPLFNQIEPDLRVATVCLTQNESAIVLRVSIFVHRGRFFSIEFPKRPSYYVQKHGFNLDQLKVSDITELVRLG